MRVCRSKTYGAAYTEEVFSGLCLHGVGRAGGAHGNLNWEDVEFLQTGGANSLFADYDEPESYEEGEATGNEGAESECWYKGAALVLCRSALSGTRSDRCTGAGAGRRG